MKKRREVVLLNSIEAAGAQILHDATAKEWNVVTLSTNKENLLGPFRYGSGVRVEYFDPAVEVRQLTIIGASTSKETILANTRYRVEIGTAENRYESDRSQPGIFAYTSSTTLSGTAATDRAVVYRALRDKINRYAGANCTAYTLSVQAFTLGTHVSFTIGEQVTQETSTVTANIAKVQLDAGTFAGADASGYVWFYNLSSEVLWDAGAKLITGATAHALGTAASTVHAVGLAVLDSAGYYTSNFDRGGKNYVGVTQGFSTDVPVIAIAATYSMGIGDDMIAQAPVWDNDKQDIIRGNPEYIFNQGNAPISGYTYTKCVIVTKDGDEDALGGTRERSERESVIYVYYSDGDLADFKSHLSAAVAL
jgi:hypothetical protein